MEGGGIKNYLGECRRMPPLQPPQNPAIVSPVGLPLHINKILGFIICIVEGRDGNNHTEIF
jgi:hypothetical protein